MEYNKSMKKRKRPYHDWWIIKQFKGDMCLYACCGCDFKAPCGDTINGIIAERLYHYCPNCGLKKKWYTTKYTKSNKYLWE